MKKLSYLLGFLTVCLTGCSANTEIFQQESEVQKNNVVQKFESNKKNIHLMDEMCQHKIGFKNGKITENQMNCPIKYEFSANIFFKRDDSYINKEGQAWLKEVADDLKARKAKNIKILAHTNTVKQKQKNLFQYRMDLIRDILAQNGIYSVPTGFDKNMDNRIEIHADLPSLKNNY